MSEAEVVYKTDALIAQDIDQYLKVHEHKTMLRFITCGSVDDGKSTLIGRLLYDSKMIFEDQLAALEADSKKVGTQGQDIDFALLVAGRIGNDEAALGGGEEAVGDVDGDALLPLGLQSVDQQREVDVLALRAVALRIGFQRVQLVLEDLLRFEEQPADQRRLAVVDAAAGNEAQAALHQK